MNKELFDTIVANIRAAKQTTGSLDERTDAILDASAGSRLHEIVDMSPALLKKMKVTFSGPSYPDDMIWDDVTGMTMAEMKQYVLNQMK